VCVARSQADPAAFADLYRRYVDPIYRYCFRALGTKEAAEDATSLVFAKALAALPTYRADGSSFRAWLFAIAHNAVADDVRGRRPTEGLEEVMAIEDVAPSPEERFVREEADRSVRALLAQLPPEQARVVELRLAGLTGPEVARALGRNPNTVKVAQHRAYTRLRAMIKGQSGREEVGDGAP
jgi:RNA polymerase sigma-70 factor (ECF subfamily)